LGFEIFFFFFEKFFNLHKPFYVAFYKRGIVLFMLHFTRKHFTRGASFISQQKKALTPGQTH